MSNPLTKDAFGVTLEGHYRRSVLPESIEGLTGKDRIVCPGTIVDGSLCSSKIVFESTPFTINGSVLAINPGTIRFNRGRQLGIIRGPVAADGSIVAESEFEGGTKLRLCGDVAAGSKIKLESTVVYGNVIGDEVRLKDCIVVGVIHGKSLLQMENVLCFWFLGGNVQLSGVTGLLFWGSAAQESLQLNGNVYCLPLADLAGDIDSGDLSRIALTKDDLRYNPELKLASNTSLPVSMLACYDRVINLDLFQERLKQNVAWLEQTAMDLAFDRFPDERCAAFETRMWRLLARIRA
ncbi:hypothetical protein JW859_14575 [bacterium]|nr:hypothetical protein [bacterium]